MVLFVTMTTNAVTSWLLNYLISRFTLSVSCFSRRGQEGANFGPIIRYVKQLLVTNYKCRYSVVMNLLLQICHNLAVVLITMFVLTSCKTVQES